METKLISFKILTEKPSKAKPLEFEVLLNRLPENINVYKPEDVTLKMKMESSDGKRIISDAFYFEEYAFKDDICLEKKSSKNPIFRFRFCPMQSGIWNYKVTLFINGKCSDAIVGNISVSESEQDSIILSIEPNSKRVFAKPNGDPVFLIGENLYWSSPEKEVKYYAHHIIENMKTLVKNGVNHIRIVDCVESGVSLRKSVHFMRQDTSAMMDQILNAADELGIYVTFVLLNNSDVNGYKGPASESKIWYKGNGGYIEEAKDFFGDAETKNAVKDYIRYVVSRWGYSERIVTWELISEFDRTEFTWARGSDFSILKQWMKDMYECVREYDSYNHLISASIFYINIFPYFEECFDFLNIHQCDPSGLGMLLSIQSDCWRAYKKPVLITNTGITGPRAASAGGVMTEDLLAVHQPNWCGLMGGGAGNCMNFAWKQLAEFNGEWCYKALSQISKRIPWKDENLRNVSVESVPVSNGRIDVMGYKSDNGAYLWLYDNKILPTCRYEEVVFSDEQLCINMNNGHYNIEWFDARTGCCIKQEQLIASNNSLTVSMPKWSKDIAVVINCNHN